MTTMRPIFYLVFVGLVLSPLVSGMELNVSSFICGDVDGDCVATQLDYYTMIAFCGSPTEGGQDLSALEGTCSQDGYVDINDIQSWNWQLSDSSLADPCTLPLYQTFMSAPAGAQPASYSASEGSGTGGSLLLGGNHNTGGGGPSMDDGLFSVDNQTNCASSAFSPVIARANGRLICDAQGQVCQVNTQIGLVRLNDGQAVVTPGGLTTNDDPRYHDNASVFIGLQKSNYNCAGRPIRDAAIDAQGYVYVAPVVVVPALGPSAAYLAAAKLQLHPGQTPCYSLVRLYDDPPGTNDTRDPQRLGVREVEVDADGNVFVLSACRENASDFLWAYPAAGGSPVRLALDNISGVTGGIADPIALCASKTSRQIYLAAGQNSPEAASTTVYALSTDNLSLALARTISISGMGHVTAITQDPASGQVWVAGFRMQNVPSHASATQSPYYHACVASVGSNSNSVQATQLAGTLALPMAAVWIPASVSGGNQGNSNYTMTNVSQILAAADSVPGDANWNSQADLDGDGQITSTDLAIATAGYQSRGTLIGTVQLADYGPGTNGITVTVNFQRTDQPDLPYSSTTTLDSAGNLSMPYDVVPGTYNVGIKALTWQRSVFSGVSLPGGTVNLDNVTLANGDCSGDNVISISDLDIVLNAMGSTSGGQAWDRRADLDGDDNVTTGDLTILLAAMQASESSAQAVVRYIPSTSSIYPGDNFTVTVQVVTANQPIYGLDYFVQVNTEGSGYFTLANRNTDNSSFTDIIFPNIIVLDSSFATLGPCNGKDLAALVENFNAPAGPGTILVSTLTIQSNPSTPAGTYLFVPAGISICTDNVTLDNVTVEAATVQVLEAQYQGQNRMAMSMNSAVESQSETTSLSQSEVPSLDDKIRAWLMDKLGNDYATFDPNNPPSYLSRQDAETAAFLWYWLQSGQ